jgi:hypothetical protein
MSHPRNENLHSNPASDRHREWVARWQVRADTLYADAGPRLRPAVERALGQGFVLTPEQARADGLSGAELRRLVNRTWSAPRRGVVCVLRPADDAERIAIAASAAALGHGRDVVVSGASASALHAIANLFDPLVANITVPRERPAFSTTSADDRTRVCRADLDAVDIGTWFGVAVTTPARTVVDLGRTGMRAGVVAADSALTAGLTTPADLRDAAARCRRWPGIRRARRVIDFADPRAESPFESVTRCFLAEYDLPTPQLQVGIAGYRVDFYLERERMALEADGLAKYAGLERLREEKLRDVVLSREDVHTEHLVWPDVFGRRAARTADHLHEIARRRRASRIARTPTWPLQEPFRS